MTLSNHGHDRDGHSHDATIPGCSSFWRMKRGASARSGQVSRRSFLEAGAAVAACSWLTPLAEQLARGDEKSRGSGKPAKSLIILWLQGGPSQLETFDPHPGGKTGGLVKAISTSVKGIQLADSMPATAEQMQDIALIRSVTSKEGDHERATYNVKTGWRPEPTIVHPSIGSVVCHQLPDNIEIPRHISILSGQWPARGGYLGSSYDAFQIGDPLSPIPNLNGYIDTKRHTDRMKDLEFVEKQFARGRLQGLDQKKTLHETSTNRAIDMMDSSQLSAFEVSKESTKTREAFGDSPFGRGCLAAVRLVEVGVRCIEVELSGWDSHITNHELQYGRAAILDKAFAATVALLRERGLLESTLVFCGGEFGRTPQINPADGRDHWPHGFSIALAGGSIRGGTVHGETAANPKLDPENHDQDIKDKVEVADIHATMLTALGVDPSHEMQTPIGRPFVFSEGKVIESIMKS